MPDLSTIDCREGRSLSRRQWLIGWLFLSLGHATAARGGPDPPEDEAAKIRAAGKKAGLAPFRATENERYLGIGDAPDEFREETLRICKELATVYHKNFQEKGFAVVLPDRRLSVITLKSRESYRALFGEDVGDAVGGHYDPETNRLVIFDNRPRQSDLAASSKRINTFTLVHEAMHQLSFNTGLLDRRADLPVAVSEGLAMYGELWPPNRRATLLGQTNRLRLQVLVDHASQAEDWIPIGTLLTDDRLFEDEAKQQLAYAEAWVLVHFHLKTPARLPKFRAYLDTLRTRRDAAHRLEDARTHLGALDRLNTDLRKHAARLIRDQ